MDLYVLLPTSHRYIRYVARGDELSSEKIEALKSHVVSDLYYDPDQMPNHSRKTPSSSGASDPTIVFKGEVLGKDAETKIKTIFKGLVLDKNADPAVLLKSIETMTDDIIDEVAPESKKLKEYLLKYTKHLEIMNDSSAITTLSVLFAFANGFDSRKSYKELTCATLIMDVGMMELTDEELYTYYTANETITGDLKQKVHQHPVKSHALAVEKLSSASEATLALVLNHHELFSGRGFPRGIRTESLFPMARVLSLAVDVFERLKKAMLLQQPRTIIEILEELNSKDIEAHLRRHNKKLIETSLDFLKSDPEALSGLPKPNV